MESYTWDVMYFVTQKVMKHLWTNHILESTVQNNVIIKKKKCWPVITER